jgi:hypothetical protein
MDPMIFNDNSGRLQSEALESGLDLDVNTLKLSFVPRTDLQVLKTFLDSKLMLDTSMEYANGLIERILAEPGSHPDFAEVIRKVSSLY